MNRGDLHFTLKQLLYFVVPAEYGSVKKAAEHIPISQPSVSTAITQLEDTLGVQLFIRHHAQGLSLTASGRKILKEAKAVLRQSESLHSVAREIGGEIRGSLSVGCFVTLAPLIIPELAHGFKTSFPDVRLTIKEYNHQSLISQLCEGELDVALAYDLGLDENIVFEYLVELQPVVWLSEKHRLANRGSINMSELCDEPMILLDLPHSTNYFLSLFSHLGLKPEIFHRTSHQDVVRTMVANNYGYTLANVRPRSMQALDGKRLVSVELEGNHRPMVIGLMSVSTERKPKLLDSFEQYCRTMITRDHVPGMDMA